MIWVDYIIISIIVFSALISLLRGFIREALSLITWICAFFITIRYYNYFSRYVIFFEKQIVRNGIAIIFLFIAILLTGVLVNYVINSLVERIGLSGIDQAMGACFGALRGIIIISVVLFFFKSFTNLSYNQEWRQSKLIPQFIKIIRWFLTTYKVS